MSDKERHDRIRELEFRKHELNAELEDLYEMCTHKIACGSHKWNDDLAFCLVCGTGFGWYCTESPDHSCHYFSEVDENGNPIVELHDGTIHRLPSDHNAEYETNDQCLFCGNPEERK